MENDTTNAAVAEGAAENYARYAETMGGRMRLNWDSKVEMSTNAHHVLIVRYAFRKFQFVKHEFPPWIGDQYMLNL